MFCYTPQVTNKPFTNNYQKIPETAAFSSLIIFIAFYCVKNTNHFQITPKQVLKGQNWTTSVCEEKVEKKTLHFYFCVFKCQEQLIEQKTSKSFP